LNATKALSKAVACADVLILNASLQYRTPWQEITTDACYEQLNCNFVSSLLLIQTAASHMKDAGWGRIITIGSVQEAKPHPDMLIYSASKAAQTNMMQSLSLQLAADGITVNNIAPGVIYTDRNLDALSDPVYAEKVRNSIPVGFYGEPEDCTGIVSLLCSDEGRYITGQNIFVDGGKSVQ
jgi:NAD(P)-dependent dehydrogenase (short-subunit alcohol dehydrogenase family)